MVLVIEMSVIIRQ